MRGEFSGKALELIANSDLEKVVVTNSIPDTPAKRACAKIVYLSVGPLLANAIRYVGLLFFIIHFVYYYTFCLFFAGQCHLVRGAFSKCLGA